MPDPVVTRFAPSPTGDLHLGNARTALFSWLYARAAGGRFLLRVEDTDRERGDAALEQAQLADLRWLGMDWDAGPDAEDARGPYRQSERGAAYAGAWRQLEEQGRAYACYCTPAELAVARRSQLAAGQPPRYAGSCRDLDEAARAARLAEGRQPVLRFRVPDSGPVEFDDLVRGPQSMDTSTIGDFVIRRADGAAVFFFANAVDDALMGVTHVLRGDDHLSNTPRQLLLLQALGLAPPCYGHLPLLLDATGAPLAKRRGSATLRGLREAGYLPAAVANYLLRLGHAGAPDDWVDPERLPGAFDPGKLGRAPAHYDAAQLEHWQREAVKRLSPAAALDWLAPALPADCAGREREALVGLLRHNLLFPSEARPWLEVLRGELGAPADEDGAVLAEAGAPFFEAALEAYRHSGPELQALARELARRTGRRGRALYMPLRIALTGRRDGPELAPLLAAIPAELVERRLSAAATRH